MRSLWFEFHWRRLKDLNGNDFTYGTDLGKLRSQTAHPAIYRRSVEHDGRRVKTSIGETELLGRRLYHYLKPGPSQHSNVRLREEFLSLEASGYRVFLDTFDFEPFEINGIEISLQSLDKKYVRRLVEAVVCLESEDGVESLNR
jgi:hypothetical protein